MMKSGTTVLAMRYRDGVIVAGDRRMTDYHYHQDDYVKVEESGNLTLIACAGTVASIQELIQTLISLREDLEMRLETPIYVDGQAELLKNILRAKYRADFLQMLWLGDVAVPILAGFYPKTAAGMVFGFDEVGGIYERKDYAVMGSGSVLARSILDEHWDPNMLLAGAEELAIKVLIRASKDNYTAPPMLAPPTVFSASKEGVRQMPEKEVLKIAWNIYCKDLERNEFNAMPDFVQKKLENT